MPEFRIYYKSNGGTHFKLLRTVCCGESEQQVIQDRLDRGNGFHNDEYLVQEGLAFGDAPLRRFVVEVETVTKKTAKAV